MSFHRSAVYISTHNYLAVQFFLFSCVSQGLPRLRNVLSSLYSRLMNRQLNPETELLITCGAYESLYCAITSLVGSGDEVIVFEPFFDCYEPMTRVAGGVVRYIPLKKVRKFSFFNFLMYSKLENETLTNLLAQSGVGSSSGDYVVDEDELRATFNEKTKMIVLNSPLNPMGKVFTEQELRLIAELCIRHNVVCLSDEVYEWLVFEPAKHIKIGLIIFEFLLFFIFFLLIVIDIGAPKQLSERYF